MIKMVSAICPWIWHQPVGDTANVEYLNYPQKASFHSAAALNDEAS